MKKLIWDAMSTNCNILHNALLFLGKMCVWRLLSPGDREQTVCKHSMHCLQQQIICLEQSIVFRQLFKMIQWNLEEWKLQRKNWFWTIINKYWMRLRLSVIRRIIHIKLARRSGLYQYPSFGTLHCMSWLEITSCCVLVEHVHVVLSPLQHFWRMSLTDF